MVNWVNKAMAVGFGGVLDLEDNEEGLVSEFYNDLSVFISFFFFSVWTSTCSKCLSYNYLFDSIFISTHWLGMPINFQAPDDGCR
jgi:hypothetical protein